MPTSGSRLSPLQERVLEVLAPIRPQWTLTGGAALAAVHLQHRTTRDLDLFWHGRSELDTLSRSVAEQLTEAGLQASPMQTGSTFHRLRVTDGHEAVILDLVADMVRAIEEPIRAEIGSAWILVDTAREILANKLCALLGRMEVRDLVDVRALLEAGADLPTAITDAASKDGGFSPLTLAWALKGMSVGPLALASGIADEESRGLQSYRDQLVRQLIDIAAPSDPT